MRDEVDALVNLLRCYSLFFMAQIMVSRLQNDRQNKFRLLWFVACIVSLAVFTMTTDSSVKAGLTQIPHLVKKSILSAHFACVRTENSNRVFCEDCSNMKTFCDTINNEMISSCVLAPKKICRASKKMNLLNYFAPVPLKG